MEKDIVSFNQALELCKIGFDDDTFCMYEIENRQLCLCHLDEDGLYMPDKDLHAPTKSQVFRWFRDKYDYSHEIGKTYGGEYIPYANGLELNTNDERFKWIYKTYEEAESACIDKLIEVVKKNNS